MVQRTEVAQAAVLGGRLVGVAHFTGGDKGQKTLGGTHVEILVLLIPQEIHVGVMVTNVPGTARSNLPNHLPTERSILLLNMNMVLARKLGSGAILKGLGVSIGTRGHWGQSQQEKQFPSHHRTNQAIE